MMVNRALRSDMLPKILYSPPVVKMLCKSYRAIIDIETLEYRQIYEFNHVVNIIKQTILIFKRHLKMYNL